MTVEMGFRLEYITRLWLFGFVVPDEVLWSRYEGVKYRVRVRVGRNFAVGVNADDFYALTSALYKLRGEGCELLFISERGEERAWIEYRRKRSICDRVFGPVEAVDYVVADWGGVRDVEVVWGHGVDRFSRRVDVWEEVEEGGVKRRRLNLSQLSRLLKDVPSGADVEVYLNGSGWRVWLDVWRLRE